MKNIGHLRGNWLSKPERHGCHALTRRIRASSEPVLLDLGGCVELVALGAQSSGVVPCRSPETIDCDVGLVRIVVRHLIGNALRFTPPQASVKFTARVTENGGVEINVTDEGPGTSDDEIGKWFQKYFRGKASQTHPGAGLGLYLVAHIAKLHGGSVRAESLPGMGSTFSFRCRAADRGQREQTLAIERCVVPDWFDREFSDFELRR